MFTAAGRPLDVVRRLNADVDELMGDKGVREAFAKQGWVIGGGSSEEFKAFIADESLKWGVIINTVRISIDVNQAPCKPCARPEAGLELVDVPVPTLQASKRCAVLVKVSAAGICGSDLHVDDWSSSYAFIEQYRHSWA